METSLFLNSFYEIGNKVGEFMTWAFFYVGVIIFVWVMFKYLDTSDLND